VRRALAPVAVWATDEGTNGVAVHVANDSDQEVDARLDISLHRRDGQVLERASLELRLPARSTCERSVEGLLGRFVDAGYAYRFGPLEHEVIAIGLRKEGGEQLAAPAVHFPAGLPAGREPLADIGLQAVARTSEGGALHVDVNARRLAYAVALEAPGFVATADFFTVPPGHVQPLTLTPVAPDASPSGVRLRPLNAAGSISLELP
jgi:beta-mannosidase